MHEGHRMRFANKVLHENGLYDHELLEVLLYNVCPRIDLNACAHRLLDKFGSLRAVFSAEIPALCEVEWVGRNMAEYINCLGKCLKNSVGSYFFGVMDATNQFRELLTLRQDGAEGVAIYILDKESRIRRIYNGELSKTTRAYIINLLAVSGAYGVFAAYIRQGEALPRAEDDKLCVDIAESCRACGVKLYDYCLLAPDGGFYSYFVEERLSVNRD